MRTVTILTHSYLNGYSEQAGFSRPFGGGLERYMHDLCALIHEKGWQPVVHQLSFYHSFDTVYEGTRVRGYPYELSDIAGAFERMAADAEGLIVYASCIWHPIAYKPGSIGICHGINWDWPDFGDKVKSGVAYMIQLAVDGLDRIVTVDSHFQTYCRSVCTFDDPEKLVLLPNAVDTAWFVAGLPEEPEANAGMDTAQTPRHDANEPVAEGAGTSDAVTTPEPIAEPLAADTERSALRVLFPRRISFERGIVPMMLLTDPLLAEFPELTVEFAGELVEQTPVAVAFRLWRDTLAEPIRKRILHHTYSFRTIREAYRAADVVVIPTVYSEGTSLSCLEAMSCGKAIVASNVGGLNDLITDGFNGRLVAPTADALHAAVRELLEDADLRKRYGDNACSTAAAFDLQRWKRRWAALLEEQFARNGL
ncbi:glycosyltransferase family 4 protein [Paenibacillus lycopersici]|uniref:Glycosyltransferase family 4 protein n=1 Tax=Paenibacillus lycopersici TaxID=2704462 RepID=A0A6C0G2G3_9BACL|nr:glycosyltransferase family 4 protein [Paenibacillus lycopersici]QHT63566.1 glycosyltransferase family 4 protein [Paenibacillus lycopersici]